MAGQMKLVESSEREVAMGLLDDVSRRLIAQSGPIDFRFAASDAERDAIFRLRNRVVSERGWGALEGPLDGREHDEYDFDALHAVGTRDGVPVATSRLIFPRPGRLLPTEEAFDLIVRPAGEVVDIGRLIVAREVDPPHHAVFWQLLALIWLELRHRGFSRVCGANTIPVIRLFESMGFSVKALGPARDYWGARRIPTMMDVGQTAGIIADRAASYAGIG